MAQWLIDPPRAPTAADLGEAMRFFIASY
jgi:hypothetical protein